MDGLSYGRLNVRVYGNSICIVIDVLGVRYVGIRGFEWSVSVDCILVFGVSSMRCLVCPQFWVIGVLGVRYFERSSVPRVRHFWYSIL